MSLIKAQTNNTNLTIGAIKTFLTVNTASGSTTLTVKNITSFADNQILVLGQFGNEGSEIVTVNGSPSGSTITLDSATVFPHSASTPVIVIDFNQVEFSHAVTTTGSKTVMATVDMVADIPDFTRYNDTTYTTGYYFIRFKNSITGLFSDYSDPIPVDGYGRFTARYVIDAALNEINKERSEVLSDEFAFTQIDNCQIEVIRELKRWSWMQKYDSIIGQLSTGSWKVAVPTDQDDQNTFKSVDSIRIGTESELTKVDKEQFDQFLNGVAYTTLDTSIIVGATSIVLANSFDFSDTGTVTIGANTYDYTANDTSTGTLTISASTTTNTAGEDVFQGASAGLPQYVTTYGGYFYYYPITASTYNGRNIYENYYTQLTAITSDAETIVIPDPTVVQNFLQWKFLKKLNNGSENDGSMAARGAYEARKEKLKQKEVLGKTFVFHGRFNNFAVKESMNASDTPRAIRDANFENTGF